MRPFYVILLLKFIDVNVNSVLSNTEERERTKKNIILDAIPISSTCARLK